MKRALPLILLLGCLSSLFAQPDLVVTAEGEGSGYALLTGVVERVSEQSLLSRMDGQGELSVSIGDLVMAGSHSLSADLKFLYKERELLIFLHAEAKDVKKLEKELEKKLALLLLYDGLFLFDPDDALVVDYTYDWGYASLTSLHKGEYYTGLDAQGNRRGSAVVQQGNETTENVSQLVATSGKILLPGMRLQKQAGKTALISMQVASDNRLGLDASYSYDVGLYPFTLVMGGGFDLTASQLEFGYARVGFAVRLPLSMVFTLNSAFWRNSSVAVECSLGLGYSPVVKDLLVGSSALVSYRYRLNSWALEAGGGSRHWVSEESTYTSGLFMQLGLAYTW